MEIVLSLYAKQDLDYWTKVGNKSFLKKITELIVAIQRTPFKGLGKPEPLKYELFRMLVS